MKQAKPADLFDFPEKLDREVSKPSSTAARPRLLDLFCCAGGAAMGYQRAGFDVVGVDIDPQPRYPFAFIQADVMSLAPEFLATFDAIHASPPCQRYSDLARRNGNAEAHPDLVAPVREMLRASGKPYIIENVEGAPLLNPVMLCGTMFPGLRVLRHRLFESNMPLTAPPHGKHPLVYTMDKRKAHYGRLDQTAAFVQVTGGGNCSKAAAADAMGIDWTSKEELNQAIPPAYTEHLGQQVRKQMVALLCGLCGETAWDQRRPADPTGPTIPCTCWACLDHAQHAHIDCDPPRVAA